MKFLPLFLVAVAVGMVALPISGSAAAAPLKVRVRGAAKLTARASRDQTHGAPELVLSGTLSDDAGEPLSAQDVTVRVGREAAPDDPHTAEAIRDANACTSGSSPRRGIRIGGTPERPEVVVATDEGGRFCFRAKLDPDRYKATLAFAPTNKSLVDGAVRELAFDLSRSALSLRFDPAVRVIPLDTPRTTIEALALLDDDGNPHVATAMPLVLSTEKGEVARGLTDASGRTRFVVNTTQLGPPGPGELRVTYGGDDGKAAHTSYTTEVERHVKVGVKVPAEGRGELTASVPEDGIPIVAELASSAGLVSEGSIEARVGDVVVGTAPIERGLARLTLTFTAQGREALVRLRYVPVSPWYEALPETTIRLPIRAPGLLSKAPIVIAGLAVLAFFLIGRVSGQKYKPDPLPAKANGEPREAKAGAVVVRPAQRGQEGWTGRVHDAHEGTPVAQARVWIERGTFDGRAVLASVETDAAGTFTLPGVGPAAGDERLGIEGRFHTRHLQDLPAPGEIAVTLVQRRRTLLARLVTWARRRGPPFDARPEPTPGHVRRAASSEFVTARWADAIERAAFGRDDVDAHVEQDVEKLAPPEGPNSR